MSAEVAKQYEEIAEWFDANRNKSLVERPYLEKMIALAPGKRLLDLGCGTGEPMAAFFVGHGFHVTGIDIAPAMIEMAKARFPQHIWHVGDIRKPATAAVYDAILAWDSFFHLTRDAQRDMFPLFADLSKKGTVLMFNTGGDDGEVYSEMEGRTFHYASLSADEYKSLLEKAGFTTIVHATDDENCGGRTVWIAQKN